MQTLIDGKICNDCFSKLGDDRYKTRHTLEHAKEIISVWEENISLSDIDYLFTDTEIFSEMLRTETANTKRLKTDLLEASFFSPASKSEAIYRGRIYSITGKDKRFPKLPTREIEKTRLELYPFLYGISEPLYCKPGQEVKYSNRPFIDDRSDKEKVEYGNSIRDILLRQKSSKEYEWIINNIPELAPKSLSGYTRMKKLKSANFMKIVKAAHELGYEIKTDIF